MILRGRHYGNIDLIDPIEFRQIYVDGLTYSQNYIEAATVSHYQHIDDVQSPIVTVAPWSIDPVNIEYQYTVRHILTYDGDLTTDIPRVPREYRWVLGEWCAWYIARKKADQNKSREFVLIEKRFKK